LEVPLQVVKRQLNKVQKSWPLRDVWLTIAVAPLHQNSQMVFQTEVWVWKFHPVDMLTPSIKNKEVTVFQCGLSVKRVWTVKSGIVFE
jgi:hypothetical protein